MLIVFFCLVILVVLPENLSKKSLEVCSNQFSVLDTGVFLNFGYLHIDKYTIMNRLCSAVLWFVIVIPSCSSLELTILDVFAASLVTSLFVSEYRKKHFRCQEIEENYSLGYVHKNIRSECYYFVAFQSHCCQYECLFYE